MSVTVHICWFEKECVYSLAELIRLFRPRGVKYGSQPFLWLVCEWIGYPHAVRYTIIRVIALSHT